MNESYESTKENFIWPDLQSEVGEFKRVATTFGVDDSVLLFQARSGELLTLDEGVWNSLENTDSNRFESGDWETAQKYSEENSRNWIDLRSKLERGVTLDAPIVMKYGDRYHLVSGNTRLMVAKAAGIAPKILLFEIDSTVQ